jgi:hypothetical protein
MGIKIEFNPDLALRNISEFKSGNRKKEECIPDPLEVGETYYFLKGDQRNYWLMGEIPLLETKGGEVLSRPIASIIILEATHYLEDKKMFTKGKFKVVEVFNDSDIHFESYARVGERNSNAS